MLEKMFKFLSNGCAEGGSVTTVHAFTRHFIRYTLLVVVLPPDVLKLFMTQVQQGAGNSPFWFTLT